MATPLFLETKLPSETFETISENMIPIRYCLWHEGIQSVEESFLTHHIMFIDKTLTVRDMCEYVYFNMLEKGIATESQPFEQIVLFKEKYTINGVTLVDL